MKKLLITLALSVLTVSCAQGDKGDRGPTLIIPPPTPPNASEVLVAEYNEQRAAVGQSLIQRGLACTLYTVPAGTSQISGATLTSVGSWGYSGVFNVDNGPSSPGVSLLPPTLQLIYTSNYIIKCSGLYVNPVSGFYGFDLTSDDGAIVNLNGTFLNNDGTHAVSTVSKAKYLARGVFSFDLSYLDIGGSHALMFKSGGAAVGAEYFYH